MKPMMCRYEELTTDTIQKNEHDEGLKIRL